MTNISVAKLVGDFIAFVVLAVLVLIYKVAVDPALVGFFCDDNSIRYPFMPSTVSRTGLVLLTFVLPIALGLDLVMNTGYPVIALAGYFVMGIFANQLFVDVAKYTTGSLRPNFIAVCMPNQGYEGCNSTESIFITNYECTNKNTDEVTDSRLSFYSGHAAGSFYASVYLFFYLRGRLSREPLIRTVLPTAQCILFIIAFYVAYTRISDYKHHLRDVIVGILMGSAVAYFVTARVTAIFKGRFFTPETHTGNAEVEVKSVDGSQRSKTRDTFILPSMPTTPPNSFVNAANIPANSNPSNPSLPTVSNNVKRNIFVY
ncbi:Lipid phosphate phosphohydrolase 2 [Toxocara canis]|uniref:Lipid phosphate phosphohydrolase 2 n=1 Tax=Toxocara canis TaxID=6265 RepID=A0A0B2VXC8_TOXCA|nr:Lipid phosphate phosphohydrolase 2 [Toxocara canis]